MLKILKYFPNLTPEQIVRFEKMDPLYRDWNGKINLISRKDIDSLYEKHILHSLAIAKIIDFRPGTKILDVGTGGGFPGIPLAILFPSCQFVLIDSIGKKIKVVQAVSEELGLNNVTAIHGRVEDVKEEFDFVISRAVTTFPSFVGLVKKNVSRKPQNALPNGIIYLKGGDIQEEIKDYKRNIEVTEIANFFNEPFFETKKVVYLPVNK
ncbi:MAG TPA: 16S rRNA (guanine(527)-N(7))-methyltransferase RsmG [Prolixibacteraceae bacterium]|nr:16S rRNA (guanine(527)-N(7))-methyltransferase RsmG [Prolixibacteraceae bacterium]